LLRRARRLFPFIERIFADGGYRGEKMARVISRTGVWKLEIVKRSTAGFEIMPKRWIVERTFAWISRNRRLLAISNVMPPPLLHSSVSP
jgi:transposase